jgi:hypothetical protein
MRALRRGQEQGTYYLVLNRSCADLYDEVAELFADRPYIEVVVDRRRGKGGMPEIPASQRPRALKGQWRPNPKVVSARLRQEVS